MKKKIMILLALTLVISTVLVGCGGEDTPAVNGGESTPGVKTMDQEIK